MIKYLVFISLLIHAILAKPAKVDSTKKWLTLKGGRPIVVARGGFSGLFPESSGYATKMAMSTSLSDVVILCNLQLSKDSIGFCQSDIRLENSTGIASMFPEGQSTYMVNGQEISGWFILDYTSEQLVNNVMLIQNVFSRPNMFDGILPVSTVEDVTGAKPSQFWLNVQYDTFYSEHKISVEWYLQKMLKFVGINYISSPEIGFLKTMGGKVNKAKTKLIFQFVDNPDAVEPTTKKTYSSILKDLSAIKLFASGILVPKQYIWPVNTKSHYLDPPTTLVNDAHKQGLEVYASGFANDVPGSYNYSYDPTAEYLQFMDNSQFSVDGFITDFPPTASEAIACFAQNDANRRTTGKSLIITHNGASGTYPGATDTAYQQAVDDGADIIDCTVQLTKDGTAFCLDSPDLIGKTNALATFMSRSSIAPEIQKNNGIFSFDLTWNEIETLKAEMASPYGKSSGLPRNPIAKNEGKLVSLDGFLEFAKAKKVTGIFIGIEHAAYLASKKGLDIVDAITKGLSKAGFDKQSTQIVLIASEDSSVLSKFSNVATYKKVLSLPDQISTAPKDSLEEIKKYASGVIVPRSSLLTSFESFVVNYTKVLKDMHDADIAVYVATLRNEFITLAFDYFSDPMVEIATYISGLGVDGIITDYPGTANKYLKSPCSDTNAKLEFSILPIQPGSLLGLIPPEVKPLPSPPGPPLKVSDVVDPPLPVVAKGSSGSAPAPAPSSSGIANVAHIGISLVAIMLLSLITVI